MPQRKCNSLKKLAIACIFAATTVLAAVTALAEERIRFDIPEQSAATAIRIWARQSRLQVFGSEEDLRGVKTHAVRGEYEPMQAIKLLIAGTGLEVVAIGENTVTVRRASQTRTAIEAPTTQNPPYPEARTTQNPPNPEEVIVTGSHIKRAGFDTLEPALVTQSSEIMRRAYTNVGQALEAHPSFTASDANPVSAFQANNSIGQTFVNFFGLGSQRTLTLVNGRRFVSSNSATGWRGVVPLGSQVDFNVIPAGLVERIETIAIGGAPIYGSDAVAGTVNVILKDHFEGIEGSAHYGVTERGDGTNQAYRLLMGGNFDEERGNAVVSLEFNEQEGLLVSERFPYRELLENPADNGPDDGIPALQVVDDFRVGVLTEGGLPYNPAAVTPGLLGGNYVVSAAGTPLQFGRNGDLVPFDPGVIKNDGGFTGAPVFTQGGDGIDPGRHVTLAAALKRTLVNAVARYRLTPRVRAFVEGSFAHTQGTEQSELYSYAAPEVLGGPLLTFSVDNPFLTQQARDTLLANGLTEYALNRNLNDITDRTPGTTNINLYRAVGGFEGDLTVRNKAWSWNLAYNYGRSRNLSGISYIDPARLANAVDAVRDPASGQIVCAGATTKPGCVPINLFGENRFSDAAADYVSDRGTALSLNTLQVLTANLSGRLPFGISDPMGFNIGIERRKESASFAPDSTQQAGFLLLGPEVQAAHAVDGGFTTKEAYTELVTPLISPAQGFRAVKALNLEGAARYVDNSIAGGDTTWSAGVRFAPRLSGWGDGLVLRGLFAHAIRAPAITELFSAAMPIAFGISDPCDRANVTQGANPSVRAANCTAALAAVGADPASFSSTTGVRSAYGTVSGNRDLQNEQADSWSFGLVYQPAAVPGLRAALDWSDISLKGDIANLSINSLLAACYDSTTYPADATCSTFHRLTASEAAAQPGVSRVIGDIANGFRSGYINFAGIAFAGLILDTAYTLGLREGAAGTVRIDAKLFFTNKADELALPGTPVQDLVGSVVAPKYRANVTFGYALRQFDADLQILWRSRTVHSKTATFEETPLNEYPAYTLLNGTLGYRVTDHLSTQLAVMNLLDQDLPQTARYTLNFGGFDPLGRRYFLSLFARF